MLSDTINIKISEKTKKELENIAEKEGRTVSDLCRFLLTRYVLIDNTSRIAVQEILKHGDDAEIGEKFLRQVVISHEPIELDKALMRKISFLLKNEGSE